MPLGSGNAPVEIVRAPGVLAASRPVQHDVIDRQLALAVLRQHADQFVLRLVALAALPEAVRPLRQQHRFAGHLAIACDHLIGIGRRQRSSSRSHLSGFGRKRQVLGFGGGQWIAMQQRDVAGSSVSTRSSTCGGLPGCSPARTRGARDSSSGASGRSPAYRRSTAWRIRWTTAKRMPARAAALRSRLPR